MNDELIELHPRAGRRRPLRGAYLDDDVLAQGTPEQPFVYANFVSSLDGRIALAERPGEEPGLPERLVSGNDFRLFQELQAQADCLVTHAGYLRALAAGRLDDILQVGLGESARDIAGWRAARGLTRQPGIAIVSGSLDFDMPESPSRHDQPVHIIASGDAPAERVERWRARGHEVHSAGPGPVVTGAAVTRLLGERGYRRLYLLTGPRMLATMLADGVLSRLYVTVTHQVLGGESFHTLSSGPALGAAGRLRMRSLLYDAAAPGGTGQWFCSFEPREPGA